MIAMGISKGISRAAWSDDGKDRANGDGLRDGRALGYGRGAWLMSVLQSDRPCLGWRFGMNENHSHKI